MPRELRRETNERFEIMRGGGRILVQQRTLVPAVIGGVLYCGNTVAPGQKLNPRFFDA